MEERKGTYNEDGEYVMTDEEATKFAEKIGMNIYELKDKDE